MTQNEAHEALRAAMARCDGINWNTRLTAADVELIAAENDARSDWYSTIEATIDRQLAGRFSGEIN